MRLTRAHVDLPARNGGPRQRFCLFARGTIAVYEEEASYTVRRLRCLTKPEPAQPLHTLTPPGRPVTGPCSPTSARGMLPAGYIEFA